MSDKMRWRYGDTDPVVAAVDAETVIEIGDLIYQDVDDGKPASAITAAQNEDWSSSAETYQERFADKFLGVAMQRSRKGETDPVRLATTGVFEFDCPSGTFELGDLIGVHADDDRVFDQRVQKVAESKCAIGRIAKRAPNPTTTVLVDIRSTVMTGGVKGSIRD